MMESYILIVDDEESILKSLKGILEDEGYKVSLARNGKEALEILNKRLHDLVLLDIWMPEMDGIEVLSVIKKRFPDIQVIMISGHGTIETAVKATKLGAFDFIEKPLSLEKVVLSVRNALDLSRLSIENRVLRESSKAKDRLLGNSKEMQSLKKQIDLVAPTDSWVLIRGENGTGKELVARAIHRKSKRANRPLIDVNCAALPEELIESELFGYEKGAFTGATGRKKGKFDLANGGTIFLDEIGDMSLNTQAKVLRILQEQRFLRLGGIEPIEVDVRVIAATNKNLEEEMAKGRFRPDLFYRLNVIPLFIPPLRERKEDIPLLVDEFLKKFSRELGKGKKKLTDNALKYLMAYDWPGNVRELKNYIERIVIMSQEEKIDTDSLPPLGGKLPNNSNNKENLQKTFYFPTFKEAKAYFERDYLLKKLREFNWNISQTAEAIGIERSHLHRKIKQYGLKEL